MPVSYVYAAGSADEAKELARQSIADHPVHGKVPEPPVIVEARFVVVNTGVVLSSGEELERRRWEVYWTYRAMPDPRPWMHPPLTSRYPEGRQPDAAPRTRRAASALPAAMPPPAPSPPRSRGQAGGR
jgi:hypothetical protein